MDGPRFDAWTRRRLGLVAGGAIASLLALTASDATADRRKHARKRCARIGHTMPRREDKKKAPRCCDQIHQLTCEQVLDAEVHYCCYDYQQICSGAAGECCRDLTCGSVPALSGSRCCAPMGGACTTNNDCCGAVGCRLGFCILQLATVPPPPPLPSPPPCVNTGQFCPTGCGQSTACAGCCQGYCDGNATCRVNA